MTSKERIKKCLRFKRPDRIGIYDVLSKTTLEEWKKQGLAGNLAIEEYFGYDFQNISLNGPLPQKLDESKFISLSIDEPFCQVSKELGLEETLKKFACEQKVLVKLFNKITDDTIKKTSVFLSGGFKIDGIWLYGDLAYQKGQFFSLDSYKKLLMPLHKELCNFFRSQGLSDIIFHSDGDIRVLIPSLIDLGIKAIEPLESDSGIDAFELRKEYKKNLVLFGNIEFDKLRSSKDAFRSEVKEKIRFLKEDGGYIYRMDKEITPDIKLADYKFAIELIKQYGEYGCL
ncbi:MAG: hypothetical protein COS99_08595 [Candidatus Omnitrophica bacterium CG07_land_8_20_14_0_80_42_15]|uniref:Uroporphyrinogen decarboxylase (URO-D) domain-containing protein n=1 Tax=Candidatus Aquitaenariimonas noxiae TaxID=1974741 RepID=A0A2J0KWM6_9BACT|nr:MAG: hypothetical protein COS99_08595 [Candidatus Omnitrophica bacterium CG07_land_8_20_14_0_80_42_15]